MEKQPFNQGDARRAYRLRRKTGLTPAESAWLENYQRAHPGKGKAPLPPLVPALPTVTNTVVEVGERYHPGIFPRVASEPVAPAQATEGPPPLVVELPPVVEAGAAPAAPPAPDPKAEERAALCRATAAAYVGFLRSLGPTIEKAGMVPLPEMVYPIVEGAATRLAERWMPQDLTGDQADSYVAVAAGAYQGVSVIVAKKRIARMAPPAPPPAEAKEPEAKKPEEPAPEAAAAWDALFGKKKD